MDDVSTNIPEPSTPAPTASPQESATQPVQPQTAQANPTPRATLADQSVHEGLMKVMLNGAHWFYWIAGFSIIFSMLELFTKFDRMSLFGLGITQMMCSVAAVAKAGIAVKLIILFVSLIITGFYVLLGYFASKRQGWSFITGIVLYSLDALLLLAIAIGTSESSIWLAVAFHGYALYGIIHGYIASKKLRQLEQAAAPAMPNR